VAAIPKEPSSLFDVAGRTALITGATGAFGEVAATTLSRAGCNIIAAAGGAEKLETVAARLRDEGGKVETRALRPNSEENCQALVDAAVSTFGQLDILVVASGVNDVDEIEDLTPDRWQAVMDANVRDPWLVCRAAANVFKKQQKGRVVLVSSARSILGHPAGYSAYCPSKSAVDGIVRALGCEWGKNGITVNAIAPTVFRSPLTAWMFADDEKGTAARNGILARIPIGRLGEPDDLAGPLLFLASDASSFMTGQVIRPDGGYTAG
jgi:NAD(P)-dependent dehydrogenase (short-subunit alcohol dehydrogenase family)